MWMFAGGLVLFGGIAWFSFSHTQAPTQQPQSQAEVKLVTLPPSMFTGKTREAYQAAQDIPEVLKEVQCYCGCRRSVGHENNLFCFVDQHAVG